MAATWDPLKREWRTEFEDPIKDQKGADVPTGDLSIIGSQKLPDWLQTLMLAGQQALGGLAGQLTGADAAKAKQAAAVTQAGSTPSGAVASATGKLPAGIIWLALVAVGAWFLFRK